MLFNKYGKIRKTLFSGPFITILRSKNVPDGLPPRSSSVPVSKPKEKERSVPKYPLSEKLKKTDEKISKNHDSSSSDRSDAIGSKKCQTAARATVAAWESHVRRMPMAKQRLFLRETQNSDSSIPQSPLSCPSPLHQPTQNNSNNEGMTNNDYLRGGWWLFFINFFKYI